MSLKSSFGAAVRCSFGTQTSAGAAAREEEVIAATPATTTYNERRISRPIGSKAPREARQDQIVGKRRVAVRAARLVGHALEPVAVDGKRHRQRDGVLALHDDVHRGLDRDGDARTPEPGVA